MSAPSNDVSEPAVPAFAFTVTALPPVVVGNEVDDVPLVPAFTEIDGGAVVGSTLTPVLALPLVLETPLPVPPASESVDVPALADASASELVPTVG